MNNTPIATQAETLLRPLDKTKQSKFLDVYPTTFNPDNQSDVIEIHE
jgi:hypothetical protein